MVDNKCSFVNCTNVAGKNTIMSLDQTGIAEIPHPVCDSCYLKWSDFNALRDIETKTLGQEDGYE